MKEVIVIRMSDSLKTMVQEAAKAHNITTTKYINRALIMMLIKDGYAQDEQGNDTTDKLLI